MFDTFFKKIIIAITIPIFTLGISWMVWTTKNVFSAQQTEIILHEHKIEADKNRLLIQKELDGLNIIIKQSFDNLNKKFDKNMFENNKILLDLQRQIGEINK